MKLYLAFGFILLIFGSTAKPTGDEQKKGEEEVPNQEHGPKIPDEELHGVLMHGDSKAGSDHSHDHEKLVKVVPNQEHGPEPPLHLALEDEKKAEEDKKPAPGPNDPMQELHGVLMHGDKEHGIHHEEHFEESPRGTDSVLVHEMVQDRETKKSVHGENEDHKNLESHGQVKKGDIGTVSSEKLVHGEEHVHKSPEEHHEVKKIEIRTVDGEKHVHGEHGVHKNPEEHHEVKKIEIRTVDGEKHVHGNHGVHKDSKEHHHVKKGQIGTVDGEELVHGEHGVHKDSKEHHHVKKGEIGTVDSEELVHGEKGVHKDSKEHHHIKKGDIGTIDGEVLIHGEHGVHQRPTDHLDNVKNIGPFSSDDDILHQLMHEGDNDHHIDQQLQKVKKVGYEDLKDIDLGEELKNDKLLSLIDVKKLLKLNKEEYKHFQTHYHGDKPKEEKDWSLWQQISRIKLFGGGGSENEVTEDKNPLKAEWETVVVKNTNDEDGISHKLHLAANSGPVNSKKKKVIHDEQ